MNKMLIKILLVGDANADPSKGRFWKLFNEFTHSLSLQIVDEKFPHNAFTYLCPSRDTTSWLDHVVCTPNISDKISKICVEYDNALYDHFPLSFYLNISFDTIPVLDKDNVVREFVNWNRMSVEDRCAIAGYIDKEIYKILNHKTLSCCCLNCDNEQYINDLNELYLMSRSILYNSTDDFRFIKEERIKEIPGWNDCVKEVHRKARTCFLNWMRQGKPSEGSVINDMKRTRYDFKTALNNCKSQEKDFRCKMMLDNLRNKHYKSFWSDVHSTDKNN